MPLLFVSSAGSNTPPYATWATAATSLQTALSAAASGDFVIIQRNAVPAGDQEVAATATYTVPTGVTVLAATNDGGSSYTYSPMLSNSGWIGNSTTNRSVTFHPATSGGSVILRGLTVRTAGTTAASISLFTAAQLGQIILDDTYFWHGNTSTTSRIGLGSTTGNQQSVLILNNPTFRFASASQSVQIRSATHVTIHSGRVDGAGITPTELFSFNVAGSAKLDVTGFDASVMGAGCVLIGDTASAAPQVFLRQVRRGAGCGVLGTQTTTTRLGVEVWEYECQVGTTLNVSGYHNVFGSVTNDATVFITAGPTSQSWRIVTTAACSPVTPFQTPWIDWFQEGTTAITPRIEILRIGSTTAYTDAEVWGEFTARVTSGSVASTWYTDGTRGDAATAQATGAGTAAWTGAGGTAWSGKVEVPSLTPAAAGRLRGRIVCDIPSATVYADQLIRV